MLHPCRTTVGSWVSAICRALEAAGIESRMVLAATGCAPQYLDNPLRHYPLSVSMHLWRVAAEKIGDPAFGIKAASQFKNTSFHAFSYGIAASLTLKDAFLRAQRYGQVVSDAAEYSLSKHGKHYHLEITPNAAIPDESVDCLVAAALRTCRSRLGRQFSPVRIEFRRRKPIQLASFDEILRAPLYFGANHTRLIFDAETIERPLEDGDAELACHNDALILRYLSRIRQHSIHFRVHEILMRSRAQGETDQETLALLLNMSRRTLQRKLRQSGLTYKELQNEVRFEWAAFAIGSGRYSPSEMSYLLGFSALSSFTRAFQRWTGQSPSEWRETFAKTGAIADDRSRPEVLSPTVSTGRHLLSLGT
jgi:AraC-like DNA-binding protein